MARWLNDWTQHSLQDLGANPPSGISIARGVNTAILALLVLGLCTLAIPWLRRWLGARLPGFGDARLPGPEGSIVWSHGMGALWRQVADRPAALWVARVEVCRFDEDPREHVKALRYDLILRPRSLQAPVFSFLAVPNTLTPLSR